MTPKSEKRREEILRLYKRLAESRPDPLAGEFCLCPEASFVIPPALNND